MKTAIIVLANPEEGDEALGRVFNALAAAHDFKRKGEDIEVVFQGTGTRWAGLLDRADHPAHAFYEAVKDKVAGVSAACSAVFGAREVAEEKGFAFLVDNEVPGTPGLASIASYVMGGWTVLTF